MKYILEKKMRFLLIFSAILFAIALVVFYYNNEKVIKSVRLMDHTQEVLRNSDEVLLDILNIETGTRGFLLTNNRDFLEPYNLGKNSIQNRIQDLEKLTSDNGSQHIRLENLKGLVEERLRLSEKSMNGWGLYNEFKKYQSLRDGKISTDKIRGVINEINTEENSLLLTRKSENSKETRSSALIFSFLLISVAVILMLLVIIVRTRRTKAAISIELEAASVSQKLLSKYSLSLIEASLDPLVTVTVDGKITDMNEALVNITGMDREKLMGTDFFSYFTEPEKAREVYKEVFDRMDATGSPLTIRHINGKLTEVLFNGSVYKDDQGNVLGAVIVARDMAEQPWAKDLRVANKELAFQNDEKEKRANELIIANKELAFQNYEKEKRAAELIIANKELAFQNQEKENRAAELIIANRELAFQNDEKEKRAAELIIANKELAFQNNEKEKRAAELIIANKELAYQNNQKELRASELIVANKELAYQNDEKEMRASELVVANKELAYQNVEKEMRASELIVANKELAFQNDEKELRASELIVANKELAFQNDEKENRAAELILANRELAFQNIEKEKRAAELRVANYARSLIEASHDPLVTINVDGKITDMNEALANITGMSRESLKGSNFFDYFTEPLKAREVYKIVFAKGSVADSPLTLRHKDGKLTDVFFNGSVYKDDVGNVLGVVIVARDVTEQKRIETELTEAMVFAELATGIAEEAKLKAESATKIAENAVKTKQQFLSNMSHEIRTPMNAIIGFTKVILKTELSPKQKEYLSAIKISGDALIVLINDILDLAKVEAGKMTFEKIPFKMVVSISAMLHLFETKIQEKNLILIKEYDTNIPEVLVGDSVRLHQIILNLVSNAVKFTSKGSITVKAQMIEEDNEKVIVEFSVKDTGIGIANSKMEKIFENFQQASSGTSRLYGGTGLGLAIVKQLVEPQGGTIAVISTPDVGSTFSFRLPFQKTLEKPEQLPEIIEFEKNIKNIKVLVAEDIALNQLLMETLLDDFGFEHDIASNGKIAIAKLQSKTYDIILMDLQMPEMNGFETTEFIRNILKSNIPIIALTADVTTADLKKCTAVGMNDYIAKPVDERLLYKKIVDLLSKKTKKQLLQENNISGEKNAPEPIELKYTDLAYLNKRTKSNPELMMKMIQLYLDQTPVLIAKMTDSLHTKDWVSLSAAAHKMIPSFAIVGIQKDFEIMAAKIQEFAKNEKNTRELTELVSQVENACNQACKELIIEYNILKTKN